MTDDSSMKDAFAAKALELTVDKTAKWFVPERYGGLLREDSRMDRWSKGDLEFKSEAGDDKGHMRFEHWYGSGAYANTEVRFLVAGPNNHLKWKQVVPESGHLRRLYLAVRYIIEVGKSLEAECCRAKMIEESWAVLDMEPE